MNNKGFLLVDALINVMIVSALSILCITLFRVINNQEDTYNTYLDRTNNEYEYLFNELGECEKCQEIEDLPMEEP